MLSADELERLSQYEAGELPDAEASVVRALLEQNPEARAALDALRAVNAQSLALDDGLSDAQADALVSRSLEAHRTAAPAPRRQLPLKGLVVFAAAALIAAAIVRARPPTVVPSLVATNGLVTFAGKPLELGASEPFRIGPSLTSNEGAGAIISAPSQTLLVAQNTSVERDGKDGRFRLVAGAAVVTSDSSTLQVRAGSDTVSVRGSAVLLMEPSEDVFRVTSALTPPHTENTMKSWLTLGPTAALGAFAGGAMTLMVLRGEATVATADASPVKVSAGQAYSHGDREPTAIAPRTGATGSTAQALTADEVATRSSEPADLKNLSRAQLVARIESLRDEKEALLKDKGVLKHQMLDREENGGPKRNYYRFSPEELKAQAAKGELQVRFNLDGKEFKPSDEVNKDVHLTPQEIEAVKAIYAQSQERVRSGLIAAYGEIGGDLNVGSGLSNFTLLQELRAKSLEGEFADAIRQVANERAGLVPVQSGGSPMFKVARLMWAEDDRVLSEVEALLGPARAEQLLNHEKSHHSSHAWGVGPAKKQP